MNLMADRFTKDRLENRLKEFTKFGMTLYFLAEEDRISISELENIFFSSDEEKSTFHYCKLIKNIKPEDIMASFNRYKDEHPNSSNLTLIKYEEKLNKIYISKLIDLLNKENNSRIDKTYVNTYNYLLELEYN